MGFFGALFGRQNATIAQNDLQAIYTLLSLRTYKYHESLGYSPSEAKAKTDEFLRNANLSGDALMQAPDGIIMKIVKDYAKMLTENLNEAKRRNITVDIQNGKRLIIEHIERHRNSLLGLTEVSDFPRTLDDYAFYRIQREVKEVGGNDPDRLGFSRETVGLMIKVAKLGYQDHVPCPL